MAELTGRSVRTSVADSGAAGNDRPGGCDAHSPRIVARGGSGKTGNAARWYENPDLSKVDEAGFVDLTPGSGHGVGGYVNVAHIQVYGSPVKR